MQRSTKKSRRHRNPNISDEKSGPFFSKKLDVNPSSKVQQPFFQAKFQISQPSDLYEREADAAADRVTSGNPNRIGKKNSENISKVQPGSLKAARMKVQRKAELEGNSLQMKEQESVQMAEEGEDAMQMQEEEENVQMKEEKEDVQMKGEEEEMEGTVQRKNDGVSLTSGKPLSNRISERAGSGKSLSSKTNAEMESAFGVDFSHVSIHTDSEAVQMNKELGAQAFTHGKDIYFNSGKYHPESTTGKRLLAHELTHVVQQNAGQQQSIQRQPLPDAVKKMKSPRFKGDPVLDEVLNGKRFLKTGDSGDEVMRIQHGLINSGHPLKNFGADGQFGSETKKAVIAFQEAHGLSKDGVIGANTMSTLDLYLSISPGPAPLPPEKGSTLEMLKNLLGKGAGMTKDEAKQARSLLFRLNNDEFRIALKVAITNGSFIAMFGKLSLAEMLHTAANLTREVVIPVTVLKPASDTVDADFRRANEIYNPHNIEIEKGNRTDIEEKKTRKIIGNDLILDEFTGPNATKEELELIKHNRVKGRLTGYWVPDMTSSRGEALDSSLGNLPDDRLSVVINTASRAQDTFPHEVGHVLGLDHSLDPDNLMAGGNIRNITGPGIDQLTHAQLSTIRDSLLMEIGKKGLGQ